MATEKEKQPDYKAIDDGTEREVKKYTPPENLIKPDPILTDQEKSVTYKKGDARPIFKDTQQGYGLEDGSNQPLSKEMLHDLQDAGQRDLAEQRKKEKEEKEQKKANH